MKSKFYCVLNTLLHRARGASELVSVQLFKSVCVPVISYALEAVSPNISKFRYSVSYADVTLRCI